MTGETTVPTAPPIHGRSAERRLVATLPDRLRTGSAVLVLTGEPGLGRTDPPRRGRPFLPASRCCTYVRSYKLHANAYVTKPVDLDQFIAAVRQIDDFFVQVVACPVVSADGCSRNGHRCRSANCLPPGQPPQADRIL
ncbi:hypothetical protein SGLAM104S_03873 [Streptomyces glaucescens]